MKKIISLSLLTLASLYATNIELAPIGVESTMLSDVAQEAQTSADAADALSKNLPSIDMVRRSGIANDILIRGQKRDNISIDIDGSKVCGACPNRMDPPISHVVANQIESIVVIEGPYDVENFGTLSGGVKIKTKKPSKEEQVKVNLGFGAWNYKKFGITGNAGNDFVRVLITASTESSDQYKDGNGDTLAQQINKYVLINPGVAETQLQTGYHDMQAYKKKSLLAKVFVTTAKNQELRLSVTANRSDNVLYANSKMDALYDDSNIYNVEYNIDNLSDTYKNINLQYYYSDVDHPMSTKYRVSGVLNYITSQLTTQMQGFKFKNTFDINSYKLLVGVDVSDRKWDGIYSKTNVATGTVSSIAATKSIDNTLTKNRALFSKLSKSINAFDIEIGARYDDTEITNNTFETNTYNALSAYILSTYNLNKDSKIFLGFGQAARVPDARELYFVSSTNSPIGTANLKQTKNREIDLGYELNTYDYKFKSKLFYSDLKDYIYIKKGATSNAFSNIDAVVYGLEISASYFATDDISFDMGASYKRGKKDKPLTGQTNTNLADMAPLRANIAINYEYANNSMATLGVQMSSRWDTIDSDNGEQVLAGWATLNAKIKHAVNKTIDFTLGMNNILNKTYAQSNTYTDLTLITTGGVTEVMLLNEPGRYFYTNLDFKF